MPFRQEIRVQNALDDVASNICQALSYGGTRLAAGRCGGRRWPWARGGGGGTCSCTCWTRRPVTPRAQPRYGLAHIAHHVIGCHLNKETRVQNASGDMVIYICQALSEDCERGAGHRGGGAVRGGGDVAVPGSRQLAAERRRASTAAARRTSHRRSPQGPPARTSRARHVDGGGGVIARALRPPSRRRRRRRLRERRTHQGLALDGLRRVAIHGVVGAGAATQQRNN